MLVLALAQLPWILVWIVWLLAVPLVLVLLSRSRAVAVALGASVAGLFLVSLCVVALSVGGWMLPPAAQQVAPFAASCVEASLLAALLYAVFGDRPGTTP